VVETDLANLGEHVAADRPLFSIWQTDQPSVTARFEESQLRDMKPGQRARVHVLALGLELAGSVSSVAIGDVARRQLVSLPLLGFELYESERIPVRIELDPDQRGLERLRAGTRVEVRVRTH
jgi:membrane fusion protein (multidrug efflux system)